MRKQTAEQLRVIHQRARQEFNEIQSAVREVRIQCLEDRRFASVPGAQWEGALQAQFANKPRFEVNKVALGVIRIINEYRNNRITVDFVPRGGEDDDLAELCDGLYRADEQDSGAQEAQDNAFDEAVTGGYGAWRLRACYEDEEDPDNTYQRVRWEPIFDADSTVFFDANAKKQDKSDAKCCFVLTAMTRRAYMDEYDDDPASWPKEIERTEFDWERADHVYVAEYYKVEEKSEVIRVYVGLDDEEMEVPERELEDDPEKERTLLATGFRLSRTKKVKRKRVRKYLMSGGRVLEDCGYIAGTCIPIIPVYGRRWFVDGIERCMGHVRLAKDAQRLMNMLRSKLGEFTARSPVPKPIFAAEQMTNPAIRDMWAKDAVEDYPYLLSESLKDASGQHIATGPIGYTKPPEVPQAMQALLQVAEQDLQDILGNQGNGDEMVSNISGKAVEMIQERIDMQAYIYMSNMAKAIKRCGEVWLSMQRDLVVEPGRKMKVIGKQGRTEWVEMLRPMMGDDGEEYLENDLSKAHMDVFVDVGPSSQSKRAATVRALTGMIAVTRDPETAAVLEAMTLQNMDGEGLGDIRGHFRKKLLRMGVVKPTDEEAQELAAEAQGQQPDAQTQYLMAEAQNAQAKAVKAAADTEKTKSQTAEILAGIDHSAQEQVLRTVETLNSLTQSPVAQH